jgi:predicted sulfurtransferase
VTIDNQGEFMKNKIILFYKYIDIKYPGEIRTWLHELCESLNLKGRILIACEGINGTVGGAPENIHKYVEAMNEHPLFGDIDFKESLAEGEIFPKLKVKVRPEAVTLGIDSRELTPKDGGKHLTPDETHKLLEEKPEDLVILDARNEFEARIGKFTNAIVPEIRYFRELPKYIDDNKELFKDKQVLMYCTGGIRCERATTYLKSKNIAKEVYQIEGGIHRYIEKYPDGHFRGKNYVFDGRIAVRANDDILSNCELCQITCDDYTNCVNVLCNKQFIVCADCTTKYQNSCSTKCQKLVQEKKVDVRTIPAKTAENTVTK